MSIQEQHICSIIDVWACLVRFIVEETKKGRKIYLFTCFLFIFCVRPLWNLYANAFHFWLRFLLQILLLCLNTLDSLWNAVEVSTIEFLCILYCSFFIFPFFEKSNIKKTRQAPQLFTVNSLLCKNTSNEITIDSLWIKIFLDINVLFFEVKINTACVYFKLRIVRFFGPSYEYLCLIVLGVDTLVSITAVYPAIHM